MRWGGVSLAAIFLFFAFATATKAHECTEALIRLADSEIADLQKVIGPYENDVRFSVDMEFHAETFAKFVDLFSFKEVWESFTETRANTIWKDLMEEHPQYRELFLQDEMYELWENELAEPLKKEQWLEIPTHVRAARGAIAWLDNETRANLIIHGWLNFRDLLRTESPFLQNFDFLVDSTKIFELKIKREVTGFQVPLQLFAKLTKLAGLYEPIFVKKLPYDKADLKATYHLHFSFPGFSWLTADAMNFRLELLNALWLLKILDSLPNSITVMQELVEMKNNYSRYTSDIHSKGILYSYRTAPHDNHFELRNHYADPLTEIRDVIEWMKTPHEEFLDRVRADAALLVKKNPQVLERLKSRKLMDASIASVLNMGDKAYSFEF